MAFTCLLIALSIAVGLFTLGLWRAQRGDRAEPSCARCRYTLHGIPLTKCPECGADLWRPNAILVPGRHRQRSYLARLTTGAMFILVFLIALPFFALASVLLPSRYVGTREAVVAPWPDAGRAYLGVRVRTHHDTFKFPWVDDPGEAEWIMFSVLSLERRQSEIRYDYERERLTTIDGEQIGPLTRDVLATWLRRVRPNFDGAELDGILDTLAELARARGVPSMSSSRTAAEGTSIYILHHGTDDRRFDQHAALRPWCFLVLTGGWALFCFWLAYRSFGRITRRHRAAVAACTMKLAEAGDRSARCATVPEDPAEPGAASPDRAPGS